MENKKTKLTISGNPKKSFKDLNSPKPQGKNLSSSTRGFSKSTGKGNFKKPTGAPVGFLKFPFPVDLLKPLVDEDKFFPCGLGEFKSLKDFFGFPEIVSFVFLFSISHP